MRVRLITALMGVVMLAAGCGPDTDFWGNPIKPTPSAASPSATCSVATAPEIPPYDPASDVRPPDITPGFSWIVFELHVYAIAPGGAFNLCVPVDAYAYTSSDEADTVTLNKYGLPAGGTYFSATTPMFGRYLAMQYDPTEERFAGRPPEYEAHVSAEYARDRDTFNGAAPIGIGCTIKLHGQVVARNLAVVGDGPRRTSCTVVGNSGWNHY